MLDAHTLEMAGVQHFQDVLGLVPNLNWAAGTSRPRFFQLRGIGELEQWQGAPNPSVGFLIDGIDFSGVGMPATLSDVERIEVLRGPQGTAYGANALAGLISVSTRAPRREPDASVNMLYGDFGSYGLNGALGGPIGDGEAAWRFSAGKYRSDGFRRDTWLHRDDTNGFDESSARLRVTAQPLDALRVNLTAMWVDLDNGYDAFSIDNSRTSLADKPGQDAQLARAGAVRLDYGGASTFDVISRTGFGSSKSVYSFDGDWGNDESWGIYSPYDYFERFDRDRRTFSEDLRLVSRASVDAGADFAWLTGCTCCAPTRKSGNTTCGATFLRGRREPAGQRLSSDQSCGATVRWTGGSPRRRCSPSVCAWRTAVPTTRIPTARPSPPTKPCSVVRSACAGNSANG